MEIGELLSIMFNLILSTIFCLEQVLWFPSSKMKFFDFALLVGGMIFAVGYLMMLLGFPVALIQEYGFRPAVSIIFAGLIVFTHIRRKENG